MHVTQARKWIEDNNRRVDRLQKESPASFPPPIYADPDRHLHVFVDFTRETDRETAATFFVNGALQFWMEMSVDDGVVSSIYVVPGNLTVVAREPILFDGSGPYTGWVCSGK
jgi:hypothetical protein